MRYKATVGYPHVDQERAVAALCGQLRVIAAGEGARPDWSTLRVTGPDEVIGIHGVVWYEWTASVDSPEAPTH